MVFRGAFLAALAVVLNACGGTIFRTVDLNQGGSLVVDARQRTINNLAVDARSRPGQVHPNRIVCAEPSPDVALAVANSLSGGITAFGYGSVSFDRSSAEAVAQLAERVSTVQLLRDVLYRACEAYANGAISSITYAMMMARLDETTVTLLLGELAAGAFGRGLAGAGGTTEGKATAELTQTLDVKSQPAGHPAGGAAGQGGAAQPGAQPAGGTQPGGAPATAATSAEGKATAMIPHQAGVIQGRTHNAEIAAEVAKIHRAFLKDTNLDALLVACVTALHGSEWTAFADVCRELLKNFDKKVPLILKARTDSEVRVREAAGHERALRVIGECFELQKKSPEQKATCDRLVEKLAPKTP